MEPRTGHSRRGFVKLALAAAATGSVIGPVAGRTLPKGVATAPGFQMVNGWILTDRDVAALEEMLRAEA